MASRSLLSVYVLAPLLTSLTLGAEIGFEDNLATQFTNLENSISEKQTAISQLAHQVMLNRFYNEQRIRAEGDSGLVSVRHVRTGSYDYHTDSVREGQDYAGMRDLLHTRDTLGMGEMNVVLNGVHFQTQLTDYKLVQPSTTSGNFYEVEPVPNVEVPPSVLSKATVQEQVEEMARYFKAFKDQDHSEVDYRPYFRPTLCYLEGTWLTDTGDITPIPGSWSSEYRAETWEDLGTQGRLDAWTGVLYFPADESTAILPRGIINRDASGMPVYGQWSYRYACQPLQEDLPTKHFKMVDDLSYRMAYGIDIEDLYYSRGVRFILDDQDAPGFYKSTSLLDRVASQVRGLDNADFLIREKDYLGRRIQVASEGSNGPQLNAGYYNRYFYDEKRDVAKRHEKYRGFSDGNLFVAFNEQPEVAPMNFAFTDNAGRTYDVEDVRLSWMIPVEIIYRNPLQIWNPYNVSVHSGAIDSSLASSLKGSEPWGGVTDKDFYITPENFYEDKYAYTRQPSDQYYNPVNVSTPIQNEPALLSASGLMRLSPPIVNGVGTVRLSYSILHQHRDGDQVMKELSALKMFLTAEMKDLAESFRQALAGDN